MTPLTVLDARGAYKGAIRFAGSSDLVSSHGYSRHDILIPRYSPSTSHLLDKPPSLYGRLVKVSVLLLLVLH
jgi:hypothetical protein